MDGVKPAVRWRRYRNIADPYFRWSGTVEGSVEGKQWWRKVYFADDGKQPDGLEEYIVAQVERSIERCRGIGL